MKQLYALLIFLFCFVFQGVAQPYIIKGSVTDTLNAAKLPMASIVLIRTADSVIETHTRSNRDGRFEARVRKQGKYFMRITFPGFADYIDEINVKKATTDLGDLPMVSKEHLLKEFVLTQQVSAIKIKGDTTEYMADSFKVKEGATVEDLLKKLPGIQVDKNGQVIAQGETVQKILVDGEEFFSDDPKVVMKGLQADAVKKVQVYDKKSDQADFTGIDDGQKTKTINLELKEDKKHGYFGKADAGGGSDGYFQNQAMINAFKAKRQLSAFGIASNTDKVGLGWQDNEKFGSGSSSTEITENGEFFSRRVEDDFAGWDGKYNGEGFPSTWTAGGHYADKWNEAKHHLAANYRYARQNVDLDGNTINQYSLPDSVVRVTDMQKDQFSTGDKHGFDVMYEWKIDTNTSVKITSNAGQKHSQTNSTYKTGNYFIANDAPPLDTMFNERTITSDATTQLINTDFLLRKKFSKKGRSLSVDAKENYKDSRSTGIFNSDIYSTADTSNSNVNQSKVNNTNTLAFSGKATYTEPLSKVIYTEISYGVSINNSTSENKSYDAKPGTSDYSDTANALFSSDYKFNILTNTGGLNFKFVFKDINFNFGGDVSNAEYLQTDLMAGSSTRKYNFVNFFPKAAFTYRIGRQMSFNLNYQGGTNQPAIAQIQPYRQNTDPLNIVEGNENLKQSFTNRVSVRFNNYKILQSRFLWANASFSTTSDAITTDQRFDSGINRTRYINMDGNYNGFGFVGYGFKVAKTDFMVGAQLSGSIYHTNSMINKLKNSSDNNSITFGPYVNYDKENKFEVRWNPQIIYNSNTSTNNSANVNYYVFNNDLSGSVQLPKKIEIGSSVDMMFRQKTTFFTANNNVIKWNAYIEKKLLKKGQLAVRASVFDILNQNLGFSRSANGSVVTQNSYNTIRRYAMLNVIWNFSHTPAGAPPPSGGGMRMMKH